MANRWVEFVKNYAKENNISYTCAMCEIKTKGLYKPLKKEEPKPVEKTITIKTKKQKFKKEKTQPKPQPKPKKEEPKQQTKEEKENLIKIDKVRQQLSDEKKKILNDSEEILKRPKRKSKYASLLNLQPEITDKNRIELANLNYAKKRLETNEITFKHCLENIDKFEKELEELLKERNSVSFNEMKRTNPRFRYVMNAIDFNERHIYHCKNALRGLFRE
jgi:beta-glucosidase-like glycosyl hydrolase